MSRYNLRQAPNAESQDKVEVDGRQMNRRQFLRYGFNAAGGVLAASLGALGFASLIMPTGGGGSGDLGVKYWAKGREDEAWYGSMHLQTMQKSHFVEEAAKSSIGMSGAQGVCEWECK